jgi:hypothetical protein
MAEQFFERFVAIIAPEQPAPAAGTGEVEAAPVPSVTPEPHLAPEETAPVASLEAPSAPAGAEPEPAKPGDVRLPPVLWATGLAAVIGAMLYFFTGRRVTR